MLINGNGFQETLILGTPVSLMPELSARHIAYASDITSLTVLCEARRPGHRPLPVSSVRTVAGRSKGIQIIFSLQRTVCRVY